VSDQFWYLDQTERVAGWDDRFKLEFEPVERGFSNKRRGGLHVTVPRERTTDFVWTEMSECLVQERTLDLLREHRLTGFITKPATARFENSDETPPALWEFIVIGWGGMARPESGIRYNEEMSTPEYGFLKYTELVDSEKLMDVSQWDGSDFFIVWPLPRFIMVTDRAVSVIRRHRLTGVRVRPLSKLTEEISGSGLGFSPGRLSDFMPDERARELGEPLGIY
jgi:hypothetical protein